MGSRLKNRRIEQAAVADHPAVVPAQRLSVIRWQALLPAKHRQCASTPHERILDIGKYHDTRAIQRPKRRCQIDTRHVFKARKTGGNIAATLIDKVGAQRLQHAGATVVGGAAAQPDIDRLYPGTNRTKYKLANAIGRSGQGRRLRTGRKPDARRFGHLNNSRLVLVVHQHPGRHAIAQGACNLTGRELAGARGDGVERSLATIRQWQSTHLGIGPHTAHAFGNRRLRPRARNAALKGINRQQHTAGPAARGTKIDRLIGNIFGTRERLGMSGMRLKIGPTTAASAIGATQPTKIVAQHLTTLIRQHAGMYVKPMIQARIGIQVI